MAVKRKLLLGGFFLSFGLIYALSGVLYALAERATGSDGYEIFRFKQLHADLAKGPLRLLLAGGSNVIWGYRSEVLEKLLHVPTTNLGLLREGGDPKAMRALTISAVRKGDIVVYSSTAFWQLRDLFEVEAHELLAAAGLNPVAASAAKLDRALAWYWLPSPRQQTMASTLPRLYRRYVLQERPSQFDDYNDYGDHKGCTRNDVAAGQAFIAPGLVSDYVAEMKGFEAALNAKGAKLVLDLSWLYVKPEERARWVSAYQPLFAALKRQLTVANGSLDEVLLTDAAAFCDTVHHLVDQAALARSEKLARFLALNLAAAGDGKPSKPALVKGHG